MKALYTEEIKASLQLAWPIIIGQLGVVLMGTTDNIMIGRLIGDVELGAAGLAHSVAFLIGSIGIGGIPVIAPLIAKSRAKKDNKTVYQLLESSLAVGAFFSVLLTVFGLLIFFNFEFLKQTELVNTLAKPFYLIILLSNIPLFLFLSFKQLTDGYSISRIAMIISFIGLGANVILNYVLINNFGLMGAAYATLLVRILMLLLIAIVVRKSAVFKNIFEFKASLEAKLTKQLIVYCIPGGLQMFFEIGAFSFAVIMMGWISEQALAAHQIAINIAAITYMMAAGIGYAGSIRVGNALAHHHPRAVRTAGNVNLGLVTFFMTLSLLIIINFKDYIIHWYTVDAAIHAIAVRLLVIAALFQLSDGVQVASLGNLRGISDVKIPSVITFIAYWVIALPLGYFLGFKDQLGASGIWYGLLAGLTFAAIFLTIRFYFLTKKTALN